MKIGSHIKPRNGTARRVPLFGSEYVFKPEKDKAGATHFVAEVSNPDHAEVLLKNGAFYAFDKSQAQQPTLSRASGGNGEKKAAPTKTFDVALQAEAKALLDNNIESLGAAIGKVSSPEVVTCALALEREGSARKGAITLLETTVQALAEAGVQA